MRHIVIGAGATLAEAMCGDAPKDQWPPLMSNFAKRMWSDFNPHPFLDRFLESLGYLVTNEDGRELFYGLEAAGVTNVEQFFEFAWRNRERSWGWSDNPRVRAPGAAAAMRPVDGVTGLPRDFIKGLRITSVDPSSVTVVSCEMDYWENLLCSGIGREMQLVMIQCFAQNGARGGFRSLDLSRSVVRCLEPGDLVVNLNYDTVFEIAMSQAGVPFAYVSSHAKPDEVSVAKPHGSMNMIIIPDEYRFTFGQPDWLGSPEPPRGRPYLGFVPPRLHKSYEQHPIARMILSALRDRRPDEFVFWGVGLTESDADLLSLYRAWARRARVVQTINPDPKAVARAEELLRRSVERFDDAAEWVAVNRRA
jgi:hypothetical protein